MPNWVNNILIIRSKNDNPQEVVNFIKQHYNDNGLFDFNTFIHEPSYALCPKEYNFDFNEGRFACNRETLENPSDRDWFNWYDWRIDNWGTKWNAGGDSKNYFDTDKILREYDYFSPIIIHFRTAWRPPFPVFEKMYKMHPELTIEIIYHSTENGEFGIFYQFKDKEVDFNHYTLENYTEETIKW